MKIINLFIIVSFLFNFLFADDKKLKIAIATDMIPYSFVDEDNIPSGILVDYWKLWAKKTNKSIEFIPLTWNETLKSVKKQEVDIHSGLFKNERREEYINYIKPIYISQSHIYVNKENQKKISSIKDINGKTIGLLNGAYFESFIKKNYPKVKIKKFDTFKKLFKSINTGEIDLFIDDSLITWYQLINEYRFNKFSILPNFELSKWFHAGIRKNDKNLEQLVLSGMKKISNDELIEIEKKWIISENFRYFEKNKNSDSLTYEERFWLLKNPNASLAVVKDWDRYSFLDDLGELKGFHLDLIKQINENLKTNIKYKLFDSWSKAFASTKNGNTEGILGLSWSKKREDFFDYSPSYHYSPYYIIARKDDNSIKSLEDFNTKTAATYKNSITNNIIKNQAPETKIIHINNVEGILKAISQKKADTAIIENAKVVDLNKYNLKIVDSVFTKYGQLAIGTAKSYDIFRSIIKKGINSLSKEQLRKLKNRWLDEKVIFSQEERIYIKNSPALRVGIEDWTAIIGTKDGKKIEGIGGELAIKAFEISGLNFEYIKGTWNQLLQSFKDGDIDILPTTIYTDNRASYGEFSKKYLSIKSYIYVKSNNNAIKSFKDLKNKRLAIQKDFGTIPFVKEKFPEIDIIETEDLEDSIHRVLNGEVDALFELQISVENKMREYLITNLKSINQNSIKPQGLHIFTKKNDEILQSILNKSLENIPNISKNEIISKWINTFDVKKEVNVAFGIGRDPYVLEKDYIKGIEYDLVSKILNLSSISIKNRKNVSVKKLETILKSDPSYDIAVNMKLRKDDNLYYSNKFLDFENIVVSRASDNLKIKNVSDLKGKKLISFFNAHKFLGDEYFKLFNENNKPKTYSEMAFQEFQVKSLLEKKTDLIILDKNMFRWFFYKLSNENINEYTFHYLFPKKNPRYVAFRDKNLRDIFNKNLEVIKASGAYDEIFSDYTHGYIEPKVKINSLISSLVANYIFSGQIEQLNKIVDIFASLPHIEKLEVYDEQNDLLSTSSNLKLNKFTIQDSYHFIVNVPQKVGYIKVYFDNSLLNVYKDSPDFIPKLELFEDLKSYEYIKAIYKKFGYFKKGIDFTKKERAFLKRNKEITFSEINWEPLSIIENDKFSGLFSDYLKLFEKQTGLKFKFVKSKDWKDVLKKFKNKEIDIIPGLGDVAFTLRDSFVSNSITNFKFAIVTNEDGSYLDGLKDLKNKTLALPKNYSSYNLMKKTFPDIKIIETSSVQEALDLVSKNEADAFVGHSAIAVYNIRNNFPKLKVAGLSDERFNHYVLIQNKYPELLTILNKVIFNISPNEKQELKYKWIQNEVSTVIDYSLLYKIVAVFTIVLIVILIFTKKISRAKKQIELTNKKMQATVNALIITKEELTDKTKDLEEQKNAFETLFNDTADGFSLLKDGRFIDCNNAVLKILKYKTKEEFLNLKPHELSPEFQPDGQRSDIKAKELIEKCFKTGSDRFEWVHTKSTGKEFWVEVVLTKIKLNHEDMIHVVWRDIGDKKVLEKQILNRNKELEKSNHELEISINNLEQTQGQLIESEKMASLGALVAGVAHEINTPIGIGLTGASHFLEISKKIKSSYHDELMTQEDFEEYLKTSDELATLINSNLKRAANLVKSFKQVAVDQTSEEKREFNLKVYIDEILSSIHNITKKTNLDIFISCDKAIKITSYPGAISQILTNLIMNSIIHGYENNEKGKLSIEVRKKNDEITLIYKDDGKGIEKENLNRIFDPFFTTKREHGGSGLGLNIIYNIVTTKLNGKIKCKNNDKGVEFIINFKV